ncbi:3-oxoacyl-[acyl-carrier protein] reductase [Actinacidiphila yanglinensis]|uniref:3-oxoacyl-[acyl-carrier protein] reductase n=1 Tax=Actinacidiphila yanglinensis TaxID=310779 RepID=A0A1H6AA07_9ACTN|nr:SDR family oxidoreductase [Actinacidiphila yanglinensis]SEG44576.1 3-oxoacyl-[acyl-carrier protein] reductase [Actinacidiphila yanglinensis]
MTRTVLVTGGSGGIGRAIAARFAADGAQVVLTGRHADTVERTAKDLGARGIVCDATDPGPTAALAAQLPTVDVLVNAAGGLPAPSPDGLPPLEALLAQWSSSLGRNLLSAVLTTAAVRDSLADGGAVISIGSIGAERRGGSYGAAKAALGAWSTSLSAELAPHGLTSNVISPGYVTGTEFFRGGMTDARHAALIQETHNGRPGTPGDIAETAFFLASPGARHITGQTLHVNGGAFTTR